VRRVIVALVLVLLGLVGVAAAQRTDYRIGPDDILAVSVWDNRDIDHVVFVRPDGKVSLPILGDVEASGLTVAELIARLNERYAEAIKGAQVTVIVKEIRSRPVFFVGAVARPGPIQLTQELTVLQAVSVAGGLAGAADPSAVFVLRSGKTIPVDFTRVMKGEISQNVTLEPGDTIVVPSAENVYVQGEVKRPGTVKFSRDLTVVKAIGEAGGFTDLAAPKRVTLLRGEGREKEQIRVNVDDMINDPKAAPDIRLRPDDVLIVPQRLF
jgi:polysaccharide export outer membrane protein